MNTRLLRINGFEKFFAKNEGHLRRADQSDVQAALTLCADHRTHHNLAGTRGWSKDRTILDNGKIPASVYFGSLFDNVPVGQMDTAEKDDMWSGFFKAFTKFKCRG